MRGICGMFVASFVMVTEDFRSGHALIYQFIYNIYMYISIYMKLDFVMHTFNNVVQCSTNCDISINFVYSIIFMLMLIQFKLI